MDVLKTLEAVLEHLEQVNVKGLGSVCSLGAAMLKVRDLIKQIQAAREQTTRGNDA